MEFCADDIVPKALKIIFRRRDLPMRQHTLPWGKLLVGYNIICIFKICLQLHFESESDSPCCGIGIKIFSY